MESKCRIDQQRVNPSNDSHAARAFRAVFTEAIASCSSDELDALHRVLDRLAGLDGLNIVMAIDDSDFKAYRAVKEYLDCRISELPRK